MRGGGGCFSNYDKISSCTHVALLYLEVLKDFFMLKVTKHEIKPHINLKCCKTCQTFYVLKNKLWTSCTFLCIGLNPL